MKVKVKENKLSESKKQRSDDTKDNKLRIT